MDIEKSFRHTKSITPQQSAAIAEVEEMFVAAAKKIDSGIPDGSGVTLYDPSTGAVSYKHFDAAAGAWV